MIVLLVLAGCASVPPGRSPTTQSTVETTTQTSTVSTTTTKVQPPPGTPKEKALYVEKKRIERILADASGISGSVGVYGETKATIINSSGNESRVRVVMSYSYEYHCNGKDGNVDGQTTKAVYSVTNNSTKLVRVEREIDLIC